MAQQFLITDHALQRFAERHVDSDDLESDEGRRLLLSELERAIPFGGQLGGEELRLLPCGSVAAIAWRDGVGIVKTVLTKEQAIVNMESAGAILRQPFGLTHLPAFVQRVDTAGEASLEDELRFLAEWHLLNGVGKKKRNALLRELGYDPAGKAGDIYRAAYRALRVAHPEEDRGSYQRLNRPDEG